MPATDPDLRSWVPVPEGSDFSLQNLPYGVVRIDRGEPTVVVAIGDQVLDLRSVAAAGLLDGAVVGPDRLVGRGSLDPLLAAGPDTWHPLRERLTELLAVGGRNRSLESALVPRVRTRPLLPFTVADYVDFYSSLEHATNLGRIFRPGGEPLLPNWRHLPVGYHGRSGTVVVSGTDVRRPNGQRLPAGADRPAFGPSQMLDIELEVGFVVGPPSQLGRPVPAERADDHIFGLVLVNDWSARDIQAWEYQPLGPFLGKSFATSISPWIVPLEALEPYLVHGPAQEPEPLEYLRTARPWNVDLQLEVHLRTAAVADAGTEAHLVSRTNARGLYWSMAQQLAHLTVNGASVRTGDLCASGTVSGSEAGSEGSLIERTWRGERPLELPGGEQRGFLEDGDEVVLTGWCGGDGRPRVGFGEVRGRIVPAAPG